LLLAEIGPTALELKARFSVACLQRGEF
jgi:hypothetical protein